MTVGELAGVLADPVGPPGSDEGAGELAQQTDPRYVVVAR